MCKIYDITFQILDVLNTLKISFHSKLRVTKYNQKQSIKYRGAQEGVHLKPTIFA